MHDLVRFASKLHVVYKSRGLSLIYTSYHFVKSWKILTLQSSIISQLSTVILLADPRIRLSRCCCCLHCRTLPSCLLRPNAYWLSKIYHFRHEHSSCVRPYCKLHGYQYKHKLCLPQIKMTIRYDFLCLSIFSKDANYHVCSLLPKSHKITQLNAEPQKHFHTIF